MTETVKVYSTPTCPHCLRLKEVLRGKGIDFQSIDVASDRGAGQEMLERTGKQYVPQIFIGDEYIGGYNDFLLMDAKGEIDTKLGLRAAQGKEEREIYDLVIIGGGPAGLTAAVYAARKNLKTVMVTEMLGGQPMLTSDVENYMGYQFITGPELMKKFEEQTLQYKVEVETGDPVSAIEMDGNLKRVITSGAKLFLGRTVIIASGKRSRSLNVSGEYEYAGRGVSYCATCDGPLYKGKKVMVAGGGNSAAQAALELAEIASTVHIVSLTELTADEVLAGKLMADGRIQKHLHWRPEEINGDGSVEAVVIVSADGKERREIEVEGLFVEIGLTCNSSFAVDLLELNEKGEILIDSECRTGVKGVFAAGDVTNVRDKQIVVAAGEGAKAALSAHEYLLGSK